MSKEQWVIVLFTVLYFSYILYTRKRGNFAEFSVANRGLGFFLIFASISASYLGPAFTLGISRKGFSSGMSLMYIVPLGGLVMVLVGFIFVPTIRSKFRNSYSMGDVIGGQEGHNHPLVKAIVGIVNLFYISAVVVAMSYAGGELINNVFGFSKLWSIAAITSIVVLYSVFGGIRATIQTDALQFIHFVILIPLLAWAMIKSTEFNWNQYLKHSHELSHKAYDTLEPTALFGLIIVYLFSSNGLDAPIINRYLASKSERTARNAAIFSGIFISAWLVLMLFIGSMGSYLYPDLKESDQILLFISKQHYSGIMYGIFIVAMIGVVMSTQDSLLNASSVCFAEDLLGSFKSNLNDHSKLFYSKTYTIILGLVSIGIASYLSSILDIILGLIEFFLPVLLPVTIFSIVKERKHWKSALFSMTTGFISYLIFKFLVPTFLPASLIGMILSTFSYFASDFYLRNQNIDFK